MTRQAASLCEDSVKRQRNLEMLDAEIDAFNNLIAAQCTGSYAPSFEARELHNRGVFEWPVTRQFIASERWPFSQYSRTGKLPVRTGFFGARKCSAINQPWT